MPNKAPVKSSSSKNLSIPLNSQTLLVVLLVVVSFFTGYLFFKVQNLEKNGTGNQATAGDQQAPQLNLTDMPKVSDKDHIRGNKNAKVVLVEYSDYECPFCQQFHPTMLQIMQDYGDKVAWVYRHYPLTDRHPKAQKSAEASECVFEQGGNDAFWKFTDAVFEKMPDIEVSALPTLAEEVAGVDASKVQSCVESGKYADLVKNDQDGGSKAGIAGTPGTIIVADGKAVDLINGALPLEEAKAQIDAALK